MSLEIAERLSSQSVPNCWVERVRKFRLLGLCLALLLVNVIAAIRSVRPEDFNNGFENTDTRVIHSRISQGLDTPKDWYTGDWPLHNGFYRPLTTSTFQFDVALWGDNFAAYRWTNILLCLVMPFAVLWFVLELTASSAKAYACAFLFSIWQGGLFEWWLLGWLWYVGFALGIAFKKKLGYSWWVVFAIPFIISQVFGQGWVRDMWGQDIAYRSFNWPPGRTALLCSLGTLVAMACSFRWIRQGSLQWLVAACAGMAFALLSYEGWVVIAPILLFAFIVVPKQSRRRLSQGAPDGH